MNYFLKANKNLLTYSLILLIFSKSAPQFIQVLLKPKDIAPQLPHVLILDLYELKPINTKTNNRRGIKNKRRRIFPTKLMKKLNPKIGITISKINV